MELKALKFSIWILRIGIFGTFIGHGILAILIQENWLIYLTSFGISKELSFQIMPIIGYFDVLIAFSVLIKPLKWVLIYAAIWAFLTASMRFFIDASLLGFIERSANWACPLALLFLYKFSSFLDR